jgi:hypothetical protein
MLSTSPFGDGEWTAVINPNIPRPNCDGHGLFPEMGTELAAVVAGLRGIL